MLFGTEQVVRTYLYVQLNAERQKKKRELPDHRR
jgi:hypothetical protein